jgi:hypothetical protein
MAANTVEVTATAADVAVLGGSVTLLGYALTEAAGSPAVASLIIRDGTSASAEIVLPLKFIANETKVHWFGDMGISFDVGIFLDMVAGTVQGSFFVG